MLEKAIQCLSLQGLRVFLFCLMQRDKEKWTEVEFIKIFNQGYNKGQTVWKDGMANLALNGMIEKVGNGFVFKRTESKES